MNMLCVGSHRGQTHPTALLNAFFLAVVIMVSVVIIGSHAMLNNDTCLVFLCISNSQSCPTWKNHILHVSVPGGVGIYIHIIVHVDTDNLITYHFLEHL